MRRTCRTLHKADMIEGEGRQEKGGLLVVAVEEPAAVHQQLQPGT
jgi:hypothetical protein